MGFLPVVFLSNKFCALCFTDDESTCLSALEGQDGLKVYNPKRHSVEPFTFPLAQFQNELERVNAHNHKVWLTTFCSSVFQSVPSGLIDFGFLILVYRSH